MSEDNDTNIPTRDHDAAGPFRRAHALNDRAKNRRKNVSAKGKPAKTDATARLEQLNRAVLVGTFTTVAALIFGVASIVSSQATVSTVTSDMTGVVVANREIASGVTITSDMVELASVPASYVSDSSLGSVSDVVGKTAGLTITKNTQIGSGMLASAQNASSLSAKISAGNKALTLNVSSNTGLYNLLRCGDLVDIYVTNSDTFETELVASKISVLALDSALSGPDGSSKYSTATLDVSPEQAEKILTSEQLGIVSLVLNPLSAQEGA